MAVHTDNKTLLTTITRLSRQFGTSDYVKGGGGNTSVKNDTTLWVKPSGTTLATITEDSFVPMSRRKLAAMYDIEPPEDKTAREALVKDMMMAAVEPGAAGRPSVEAPLHESLQWRYVVHTHPALVNGMTCSVNGATVCDELFPDALWIDYVDPGFTLCTVVRNALLEYREENGSDPNMVFLENHGVFIGADTPEEVQACYEDIMSTLTGIYQTSNIATELTLPSVDETAAAAIKKDILAIRPDVTIAVGGCDEAMLPAKNISPDHIVYAGTSFLNAYPSQAAFEVFEQRVGQPPSVLAQDNMIFGMGSNENTAALAVELVLDGALIVQLAEAFGGIQYMTDESVAFIADWEVENYRKQQL